MSGRHDHAETLVHHYMTALDCALAAGQEADELRAAACRTLLEASERALAVPSYPAAAGFATSALQLNLERAPEQPRLLLAQGLALAMEGQPAVETLERAYMELLDVDEGTCGRGPVHDWVVARQRRGSRTGELGRRAALELLEELPASRVKALVLSNAGSHLVFKPEYRARGLRLLRECLEVARARGLAEFEAESLEFIGLARLDAGDAEGLADLERAAVTGHGPARRRG